MKKRMFVCFFVFMVCLFQFSIPDTVLGQSAQGVFNRYIDTFQDPNVHTHFRYILESFKASTDPLILDPIIIKNFANNPRSVKGAFPDVDDSIVCLLTVDENFQALFRDEQFHTVLQTTTGIDNLIGLIRGTTPRDPEDCPSQPPPPPPPKRATTLSIVSGNNQSGEIGKPLNDPFVVKVLDQNGKPLQEIAVTFEVTAGGGRLSAPTNGKTDNNGQAEVKFTLGVNPGIYQVEARVAATDSLNGTPLTQIFTATAEGVPLPAPTRLAKISGDTQTGETGKDLAQPFVVRVKDNANRSLPGIGVRFSVLTGGG